MNPDRFALFEPAYRAGLLEAVTSNREEYGYPVEAVPTVADKMLRAIAKNPLMVNYGGSGFRRACKILGIKSTRKAIFAYLEIT